MQDEENEENSEESSEEEIEEDEVNIKSNDIKSQSENSVKSINIHCPFFVYKFFFQNYKT